MSVIRLLSAAAGLVVLACGAAWGQAYPSKPVRVVIVFPPGGATDIVGRIVFQKVGEQVNQQFVIENRVGAGGTIGAAFVAKSPPDGYTVMVYSATLVANAHLYKKLPYDALKDFIGITPVARLVGMLVVHPSMPVRTMKELIALAKARPGDISYGTAGVGAFQHLATSLFTNMAGMNMVHVPYKGGGPAAIAMAGGEVQVMLTPISEVLPHVQSGRVRPIAVSSDKRDHPVPGPPHHRGNREGLRIHLVDGHFRAGRHAAAHRRQAERRAQESGGGSRRRLEPSIPVARPDVHDARGVREAAQVRVRQVRAGREDFGRAHRLGPDKVKTEGSR